MVGENLAQISSLIILTIVKMLVSYPGTPKQNGVTEQKHWHITETRLTMIFQANSPLSLWVLTTKSLLCI